MFQPVNSRVRFPELEAEVLRFWKEHDVFRKSVEERPADRLYVFYEGPPTANARPGVHHVLARAFKDLFPRYKTMRGYRVPRKAGWDTHGLPVEVEMERELGLKSKREIEAFGVEEFNRRCRESVFRYVKEWEALTERIGFWVDMGDAYVTYDNSYIETGWWILKQLWDKGLVYQDYRSAAHCPRCETSLSDAEVALGYAEDTPDPSVFVKFPLTDESRRRLASLVPDGMPVSLLAWTTTPWTLPGNTALAVDAEADYAVAEVNGEALVLAAALAGAALEEHRLLGTVKGRDLVGLRYEPLYDTSVWGVPAMWFDPAEDGRLVAVEDGQSVPAAHCVVATDFVSLTDGTGVVHIAPAFGGEDFEAGKEFGLLYLQPVDLKGEMTGGPFGGRFVKDADELIMADLTERGLLLRREMIRHTYPFCWRCDAPLLYYAKPTWYIRTTAVKESLLQGNSRINWYPEHIKHGRFGDWLANNVDWALSRERYWGTPLPVWECEKPECDGRECVGSVAELREKAADPAAVDALTDLHRPYIDRVALRCPTCGGSMRRVPEVLDAWFDSGAMPYAQWHYPFENGETFGRNFPADFICEAIDQTRGWFYTLHAEATLLHAIGQVPESISYRNVICLGLILDDKGGKMSKSLGNVVDPNTVIDAHGADALRWYLFTATPAGNSRRFSSELVGESLRRFLLTLWNTYSFFVTYANIDRFDPAAAGEGERSELDRWVLSELNLLVEKVTRDLEGYNATDAGRAVQQFVEDLSNWYVRRSRRRFWKSESDADKLAAHHTLYTCLVTLAKLLAPFTPFVSEAMYQNLVRSFHPEAPESVHLAGWPEADPSLVDRKLMDETRLAMRVVSLGRAARSKAGIKVRQPLAKVVVKPRYPAEKDGLLRLAAQMVEELNVKELALAEDDAGLAGLAVASDDAGYAVGIDTAVSPELAEEGLARELVHRLQNLRKAAGFDIADHIVTYWSGPER
ncbi:MAG: isoleucine--tRNA ligase, partial [Chloroflexi bacterium]|nr:isoleucine--tRNA ligase [Chloroflexota bacterium]